MVETLIRLWQKIQQLWRPEPQDPYAMAAVPLRRGPSSPHRAAVALEEPPEYTSIRAFGRPLR